MAKNSRHVNDVRLRLKTQNMTRSVGGKFKPARRQNAAAIVSGSLVSIGGGLFPAEGLNGSGVTEVENIGRPAAALYRVPDSAVIVGGRTSSFSSSSGTGGGGSTEVHALDGAKHTGTLSWEKVNKTGSNVADLESREITDLTTTGLNRQVLGVNVFGNLAMETPDSDGTVANMLLRSDSSGGIQLTTLDVTTITNTGDVTLSPTSEVILDPAEQTTMTGVQVSNNFDTGNLGARINWPTGDAELRELLVDSLYAEEFVALVNRAAVGKLMVTPSMALTTRTMTIDNSPVGDTVKLYVTNIPGVNTDMQAFSNGDHIRIPFSVLTGAGGDLGDGDVDNVASDYDVNAGGSAPTPDPYYSPSDAGYSTGLLYWWTFESTGLKEHVNENTTSYPSGVTQSSGSPLVNAADVYGTFNGTSNSVMTAVGSLTPPTQGFLSFWFKTSHSSNNHRPFGSHDAFEVRFQSGGEIENQLYQAGGTITATSGSYNDGSWHHAVMSYDYSTNDARVYIDGVQRAQTSNADDQPTAGAFYFGRGSAAEYWVGDIADVRLYSGAISQTIVDTLYDDGTVSWSGSPGVSVSVSLDLSTADYALALVTHDYTTAPTVPAGWSLLQTSATTNGYKTYLYADTTPSGSTHAFSHSSATFIQATVVAVSGITGTAASSLTDVTTAGSMTAPSGSATNTAPELAIELFATHGDVPGGVGYSGNGTVDGTGSNVVQAAHYVYSFLDNEAWTGGTLNPSPNQVGATFLVSIESDNPTASSTGLILGSVYGTVQQDNVTGREADEQVWDLTITRREPTNISVNFTIPPDTEVLDMGVAGDGFWEASARGSSDTTPYSRVCTWATNPWEPTTKTLMGNLNAIGSAEGDWGFWSGHGDAEIEFSDTVNRLKNVEMRLDDGTDTTVILDPTAGIRVDANTDLTGAAYDAERAIKIRHITSGIDTVSLFGAHVDSGTNRRVGFLKVPESYLRSSELWLWSDSYLGQDATLTIQASEDGGGLEPFAQIQLFADSSANNSSITLIADEISVTSNDFFVSGDVTIDDGTTTNHFFSEDSGANSYVCADGGNFLVGTSTGGDSAVYIDNSAIGENFGLRIKPASTFTTPTILINNTDNGSGDGPYIRIGYNNNGSTAAPSSIVLYQADGGASTLWVDNSGDLREAELSAGGVSSGEISSGERVGEQSSSEQYKLLQRHVGADRWADALKRVQVAAEQSVYEFTYKKDQWKDDPEVFQGVVLERGAAHYGMDRDADKFPVGRSLNVVNAVADLMQAVAELNRKLEAM